jgi:hypothetical protein
MRPSGRGQFRGRPGRKPAAINDFASASMTRGGNEALFQRSPPISNGGNTPCEALFTSLFPLDGSQLEPTRDEKGIHVDFGTDFGQA